MRMGILMFFLGGGVSLKEILISFFLHFLGYFLFLRLSEETTTQLLCILWLRFRPVFVLEKLIKRTRHKKNR